MNKIGKIIDLTGDSIKLVEDIHGAITQGNVQDSATLFSMVRNRNKIDVDYNFFKKTSEKMIEKIKAGESVSEIKKSFAEKETKAKLKKEGLKIFSFVLSYVIETIVYILINKK